MTVTLTVVGILLVLCIGWYLSTTAGRLDRLNKRVESAQHSLETQLLRRVSVATELAATGLLDPVSSAVLADAAHAVRVAPQDRSPARSQAESDLTVALGKLFEDPADVAQLRKMPGGDSLADELDATSRRVSLSHRFLNDGVRANQDIRRQGAVRLFRLSGRSTPPEPFDFLDTPPLGFGVR